MEHTINCRRWAAFAVLALLLAVVLAECEQSTEGRNGGMRDDGNGPRYVRMTGEW